MKLKIEFSFGIEYREDGSALLDHERRAGMKEINSRAIDLFGGFTEVNTVRATCDRPRTEAGCLLSVIVDDSKERWNLELDENVDSMVQQIKDSLQQNTVEVTRHIVQLAIF